MAKIIDYDNAERNFQKAKKINPPPPDVVEAARRLLVDCKREFALDYKDTETVCKWVLEKADK